jgi:tRNA-intron endonuclease
MEKIQATLIANQITTASSEAHSLLQKSAFGTKQQNKISYSPYETLFLQEKNKLETLDFQSKKLDTKTLTKKFTTQNKNFPNQYTVYKDLREKGYIPKTALKFGTTFRIYKTKNAHSHWLCTVLNQNQKLDIKTLAAKNRIAHSTKKKLLLAITDDENKVTYYETAWIQP